jgi:hypothetical protein
MVSILKKGASAREGARKALPPTDRTLVRQLPGATQPAAAPGVALP